MKMLALKLTLCVVIVLIGTLAGRRWGPRISGWLAAFPHTSGTILLILSLEQGARFTSAAAVGMLLGLVSVVVYCTTYAKAAYHFRWPATLGIAVLVFGVCSFALQFVQLPLIVILGCVLALLIAGIRFLTPPETKYRPLNPPPHELVARLITVTALVLSITGFAKLLGPRWTGLLSLFPIYACVFALFTHMYAGAEATQRLLNGTLTGLFSAATFYVTVSLLIVRLPVAVTFVLAVLFAVIVHALALFLPRAFVRTAA